MVGRVVVACACVPSSRGSEGAGAYHKLWNSGCRDDLRVLG